MWYFWHRVRRLLNKWTTWLMKQVTMARERTLLLVMYIISSKITDFAKLVFIYMLTTAQDKTKTISLFGTLYGEQLINFTTLLNVLFWLLVTQSLQEEEFGQEAADWGHWHEWYYMSNQCQFEIWGASMRVMVMGNWCQGPHKFLWL